MPNPHLAYYNNPYKKPPHSRNAEVRQVVHFQSWQSFHDPWHPRDRVTQQFVPAKGIADAGPTFTPGYHDSRYGLITGIHWAGEHSKLNIHLGYTFAGKGADLRLKEEAVQLLPAMLQSQFDEWQANREDGMSINKHVPQEFTLIFEETYRGYKPRTKVMFSMSCSALIPWSPTRGNPYLDIVGLIDEPSFVIFGEAQDMSKRISRVPLDQRGTLDCGRFSWMNIPPGSSAPIRLMNPASGSFRNSPTAAQAPIAPMNAQCDSDENNDQQGWDTAAFVERRLQ